MAEPIFSDTMERLWERMPGVYKFEDAQHNWQMKKWLSGVVDVFGDIDELIDRIKYVPPQDGPELQDLHSDLVDPTTADAAWLPWLAQLVGVKFDYLLTEQQKRDRISTAIGGVQAGTKAAIIQAAQTALTGTKTVYVYSFSNAGGIGAGTQWEVLLLTLAAETASDVIVAVTNAGAKPAGVKLYHVTYGATWTTVEATLPTWTLWETKTWEQIEQL